ncbi:hypothetical protein RE438_28045 (plasmid) [Bacillus wiedmannii]|uniref:ABC-three component system protein n=1 Tax=Bacillus wiedmannii TaxID=1890302 RepID=UPI002883339C|nr:ABC-three component system protein [Bacillus wiedmannii]WMS85102.1 hypothetical protein RE438_28045 [Bacillus wiedmannii]
MSITEDIKHFHDATPTWSGYNHQGKVALLIALDMILDEGIKGEQEAMPYSLELEWLEDVAIKKNDEYIAIHQVKAYKNRNISNYGDAIWMLLGKAHLFNIPKAYLHTILSVEVNFSDIKDINLKDKNEEYRTTLNNQNAAESTFEKFAAYLYSDDRKYCPLEDIDVLIQERISTFINSVDTVVNTEKQIKSTYLKLLEQVHKNVLKRHSKIQAGIVKQNDQNRLDIDSIEFSEIIRILIENYEDSSDSYYIYTLKQLLSQYTDEFLAQLYEDQIPVDTVTIFKEVIDKLLALGDDEFLLFCKKISPHTNVKNLNITEFHNLLPEDGIYDSLFTIIKTIARKPETRDEDIRYALSEKIYMPTAINASQSQGQRIARGILNNDSMLELLFSIDTMISERMNIPSIGVHAQKVIEISAEDLGEENVPEEESKFTKIKKIRVIDVKKSKEELDL